MKTMSILPAVGALAVLAAVAAPAAAQKKADDAPARQAAAAADMTDGEIRKVDKEAKKLTIKHGEIRNLEMPAMTMVFQVKDAAMLDQVKAGDKVRFVVQKSGSAYVVTDIQSAK